MDASMIFLQHLQVSTQTAPAFLSRCCKQRTVTRRTSCGPPPPGVSMAQCRIQKPQKEQNHHDVCNPICVCFWSFWGCYYISVGLYVVSSFYLRWLLCPYLFLSSSNIWRIQIMWSACGMLTSFRRRKRSPKMGPPLFPDGGNRFWHLPDIQKLASLHALLAQRMGLLEAPSFLIT